MSPEAVKSLVDAEILDYYGGPWGYEVVFDEAAGQFGLAITSKDHAAFIGYHGSFVDTLEGM